MEITQHSNSSAQICRLCATEHENVAKLFTNHSQEVDRLTKSICGYVGIECIDDGVLPNWLCAGCQLDAESTEKFLSLVKEAQQKLRESFRCKRSVIEENASQSVLLVAGEINRNKLETTKQMSNGKFEQNLSNIRHKLRTTVESRSINYEAARTKKSKTTAAQECRPKRFRRPPKRYDCEKVATNVKRKMPTAVSTPFINNSKELNICSLITNEPIAALRTTAGAPLAEIVEVDPAARMAHKYHSKIYLVCDYCKEVFAKHKDLLTHLETHNNCAFECTECLQSFLIKSELEQHQHATHHEGMGIIENMIIGMVEQPSVVDGITSKLNACKTANVASAINIVVGDNGEITCIDSHLNSPSAGRESVEGLIPAVDALKKLQQNERKSQNKTTSKSRKIDTKFACLKCNKQFDTHYAVLRHHKQVHIGERIFKCQQCSATFKNQTNYAYHMAKHTGQRQYKCETCSKAFILKHELTLHMRTHTGDKPYKCVHCPKAFAHRSNLVVHLRLHTGQRPFQCVICGASFNSSSHFKTHRVKHLKHAENHMTQKPQAKRRTKADNAQQEYLKIAVNLKANMAASTVANQAEHTAPTCRSLLKQNVHKTSASGIVQSNPPLRTNVKIMPPIQIASRLISKESDATHQIITPPAAVSDAFKYQCTYCSKLFRVKSALTKHVRTHTGEKPYRCPYCPRTFADPSNLKKHKKQHKSATEQLQTVSAKLSNANLKQQLHQTQYGMQKSYTMTLSSPARSDTVASDPDPDGLEVVERIVALPSSDPNISDENHFGRGTKVPALCAEGLVCISYPDPENPNDRTTTQYFLPN